MFNLQVSANTPSYLCDSIFLQIQEDICTFQGEDTLLHFYTLDSSWLHSHRNTHRLKTQVQYNLCQICSTLKVHYVEKELH